ncbi:MAG: alpha-glucan family phosphorylase, partial [Thermoanaerobaculia bacterium]
LRVELPGRTAALRVLRAQVGRVPVYLLDADIPENPEPIRALTRRLYVGDRATRIAQEVLCGIGGVRALRALGLRPSVYHLNEGHVAFLGLERIRELTSGGRLSFAEAVEAVAADTVFTTHTPVPEGNEVFALALARRHLAPHCRAAGIPVEEFLKLGVDRGADGRPVLSMTVLALRLSRFRNGVSRLHGQVSRRMWSRLWPGIPAEQVPIASVTNGIHTPTWAAAEFCDLYRRRLGEDWTERLDDRVFWRRALRLRDEELWAIKRGLKEKLAAFVYERVGRTLDPEAFTIGFSRRFALYKRAGLLFRDAARARRLFGSRSRPVQIVYAGKPHPE